MKTQLLAALPMLIGYMLPSPAWADAATHRLRLTARRRSAVRLEQDPREHAAAEFVKAGNGLGLLPYAQRRAGSANDPDLRSARQRREDSTTDHAPFRCARVRISKIEVTCPEARDRCPGFFYIQVPALRAPRVAAQKVGDDIAQLAPGPAA